MMADGEAAMTEQRAEGAEAFLEAYERASAPNGASWFAPFRKAARERFRSVGIPGPRDERWKYTHLGGLAKQTFEMGSPDGGELTSVDLREAQVADLDCPQMVFVNGVFQEELSSLPAPSAGIEVHSLSEALLERQEELEAFFSQEPGFDFEIFADLNTALFSCGSYIRIRRGTELRRPLYLIHLTSRQDGPFMSHPRNIIHVEEGAGLCLVEDYCGPDDFVYLSNPVTEFQVEKGARVLHHRLVREGDASFHISSLGVRQADDSAFSSSSFCLSGGMVRNDVVTLLGGEGIECDLNGLIIGGGKQHIDNHTRIHHARANCNSRELYKAVLDDESHGVFNGKIYVAQDAQKTHAIQTNQSLLLSPKAVMDTKPELEIYADDVKCTHGATVGQLNEDGMFYLRSRGIDEETARVLLVYAFASDLVSGIELPPLREAVERLLFDKLPGHCEPAGEAKGAC